MSCTAVIILGAALAMLDRRGVRRWHKAWIDVAETAIAGNHMWRAFLDTAEFTIPHHVAGAEILYRAPRRIAEAAGVGGGRTKANRCRKSGGGRQCRSEADCHGAKIVMAPSLNRRDVDARPPPAAASDATIQAAPAGEMDCRIGR